MARKSVEALAAEVWRVGSLPPEPPKDLRGVARTYWQQLASSKPADHWTGAALILLDRFCRTAATAASVQKELDLNPVGPDAAAQIKAIVALNSSCASLATKLRLCPIHAISRREEGRLDEKGPPTENLLGGAAVHERPRRH